MTLVLYKYGARVMREKAAGSGYVANGTVGWRIAVDGVRCTVRYTLRGSKKEEGEVVVMHCLLVVGCGCRRRDAGLVMYEGSLGPHVTVRPGPGKF
jgi:hypothetical protein